MKKSTLITTIAMIVVVVVALSTATYAWFTAGATTVATAHMQTVAAADFSLTVVKGATESADWSTGVTGSGIELSGTTEDVSLIAPTTTIATTVSYSTSIATVSTPANFYDANFKTSTTATVKTDAAVKGIDAIRLTNIKSTNMPVYLYVIVAVDADKASANSLYAAQATSFYVTSANSGNESLATAGTWSNGYVKATTTNASVDDVLTMGSEVTEGTLSTSQIAGSGKNTIAARPTYDGLTTSGFIQAGLDKGELGITANQYVLAYLIELGTLKPNESLVLGVYTWLDGWKADNAAGGANYNVTYAFTSTAQTFIAA